MLIDERGYARKKRISFPGETSSRSRMNRTPSASADDPSKLKNWQPLKESFVFNINYLYFAKKENKN